MSTRNVYCCNRTCSNSGCDPCRRTPWYTAFVKPLAFFIVTTLITMSVSHVCDKYSASLSLKVIKTDLGNLRNHMSTLSMEVKNVMETRDELRNKLREISHVIPRISDAILSLRNEVAEGMDVHTKSLLQAVTPDSVRDVVRSELQTYDADKTGRTDYALESSGGRILSTRDTETYSAGAPVLTLFGMPLCQQQNTPRAIIQAGVLPGECWAFKGSAGCVVIQLLGPVFISGVSLEHISASISPTAETTTAPREFSVWGLDEVDDENKFLLGDYTYDNYGPPVQYFEVKNDPRRSFEMVELNVHSNSGNHEYTCIYRIRIHGSLSHSSNQSS